MARALRLSFQLSWPILVMILGQTWYFSGWCSKVETKLDGAIERIIRLEAPYFSPGH